MQLGSHHMGSSPATMLHEQTGPPATRELGAPGVEISGGNITSEEYAEALKNEKAATVFDKMRKNDAMVFASLLVVQLPLRAAEFFVEPQDEKNATEREWADALNDNLLEGMRCTWDGFMRHAVLMFPFGVMLFEKVIREDNGLWVMDTLAPRMPKTIDKWVVGSHGEFLGVVQDTWVSGTSIVRMPSTQELWLKGAQVETESSFGQHQKIPIPAWKLLRLTFQEEGANYAGISLLRSSYKHWYIKDRLYRYDAIGLERQSVGVPYAKAAQMYTSTDVDNMKASLRQMRTREDAYAVIPHGWEMGFMDMGASSVRNPMDSIEHHNRMIAANVLASFLTLGMSRVGTQSLGGTLQDMFMLAEQASANQIADTIGCEVVKPLTELNFGENFPAPNARMRLITELDFGVLSEALSSLAGSNLIKPDEALEAHIRRAGGLPPMSDNEADPAATPADPDEGEDGPPAAPTKEEDDS